jgi:hypothetical protein
MVIYVGQFFPRDLTNKNLTVSHTYKALAPRSRVHLEALIVAQLVKKFPVFMYPDGSLSCSLEPDTESYPKPDESNPYPQTLVI